MSSERETVASFWHGGPLSSFERLSLTSFVRAGYRVALYAYRELDVPEAVELRDARDVLPESSLFANVDRPALFALFSNWFRYRLMSETGCTWIDTDSVLIGARLPDSPYLFGWEDEQQINGAFLRFPRGNAFVRLRKERGQRSTQNNLCSVICRDGNRYEWFGFKWVCEPSGLLEPRRLNHRKPARPETSYNSLRP